MALLIFNLLAIVIVILAVMALAMFGPTLWRRAYRAHPRITGTLVFLLVISALFGALIFEKNANGAGWLAARAAKE